MDLSNIINIIAGVLVAGTIGAFIRYIMSDLKLLKTKVQNVMSEKEIKEYVNIAIDQRLQLIEYKLDELKTSLEEIRKHILKP